MLFTNMFFIYFGYQGCDISFIICLGEVKELTAIIRCYPIRYHIQLKSY